MARFEEVARNQGVDSVQVGKEWMMVPERGLNLVRLTNGTGFKVAPSTGAARLTIQEVAQKDWPQTLGLIGAIFLRADDRLFRITGKHPGPAKLEAKKNAAQTSLQISVHKKVSLSLAFSFCTMKMLVV